MLSAYCRAGYWLTSGKVLESATVRPRLTDAIGTNIVAADEALWLLRFDGPLISCRVNQGCKGVEACLTPQRLPP